MAQSFDLIVIGGGSGGLAAAFQAGNCGAKVALIEQSKLGGTCVNLGCVPKKIMWHASDVAHHLQQAPHLGFKVSPPISLDWAQLITQRDAYIGRIQQNYQKKMAKAPITVFNGQAQVLGPQQVQVNQQQLQAPHIIIATGTMPHRLDIPGTELGITSDEFFSLSHCPKKVAVVGGGYIALELACLLQGLGSEVSIIIRHTHILRGFEAFMVEHLTQRLIEQGISLYPNTTLSAITQQSNQKLSIHFAADHAIADFDQVLWATGRVPNIAPLGLNKTGVKLDSQGFIVSDAQCQTSVPGIYALGDVSGRKALTPVAIAYARKLCQHLFGQGPQEFDIDTHKIPSVIFTHPPLATIGFTEAQAIEKYGQAAIKSYKTEFVSMYDGLFPERVPTVMKLITWGPQEKVIGCHLLGRQVEEMLQGFAVAIQMGACKKDFDRTLAIHPTSAEELVLLRD
jgi:glutathione reductase (NADPH)